MDDSATMRRTIVKTFKRIGLEAVVVAEDGADAYAKLESKGGINFIITDGIYPI